MHSNAADRDRLVRIRIQGFRSLDDVTLDLSGLTVLIGDNGSGKSTILEALETLRYFATPAASLDEFFLHHPWPVRGGAGRLTIAIDLVGSDPVTAPPIHYELALFHNERGRIGIASERLLVGPMPGFTQPLMALQRDFGGAQVFDQSQRKLVPVGIDSSALLLTRLANQPLRDNQADVQQVAVRRLGTALLGIESHVPFESMAAWAARRTGRRSAMREPNLLQPARRLDLLAANLGNAFHSLKNDFGSDHWRETLEYVRLGLGKDVDDVVASADAAGGQHAVAVRFQSNGPMPVPAMALSDGTLAYLAFLALMRLPSDRTLVAFDEPELHLNPGLLVRVLSMFEQIAQGTPVVLATHSDRLLDAVQDPAKSIVICELDSKRATRLVRPDPTVLAKWLDDYRGFGDIRSTGLQDAVLPPREDVR